MKMRDVCFNYVRGYEDDEGYYNAEYKMYYNSSKHFFIWELAQLMKRPLFFHDINGLSNEVWLIKNKINFQGTGEYLVTHKWGSKENDPILQDLKVKKIK